MAIDGGDETDEIESAPARPRRRRWTVCIVAGVVLSACAAVVLLLPSSYGVKWGWEPDQTSIEVDCGPAITSGPAGTHIRQGDDAVPNECPRLHRDARIAASMFAVVGIGLLLAGFAGRRRGSACQTAGKVLADNTTGTFLK